MIMTNPTMINRRNRLIDWPSLERQEKEGPGKRTAGSHLPVVICPQTTHTQIKYQYSGQSLIRAKLRKEMIQRNVKYNILLRKNCNNIFKRNKSFRRRILYHFYSCVLNELLTVTEYIDKWMHDWSIDRLPITSSSNGRGIQWVIGYQFTQMSHAKAKIQGQSRLPWYAQFRQLAT